MKQFMRTNFIYLSAFVYFILAYFIALSWFERGYFSFFDAFFQTDPNINIIAFSHGWGRHALTHAFIELSAIPFRVLSYLAFKLNLIENEAYFREMLGLMIAPVLSALTLVIFYKTLQLLPISSKERWLYSLIFALSFNNVIFSIVPETYSIAGFLISILMYFYVKELYGKITIPRFYWLGIGFIMTGVTITNVALFTIVYGMSLYANQHYTKWRAFIVATMSSVALLLAVVFLYEAVHAIFAYPKGGAGNAEWIAFYLIKSPLDALYNLIHLGASSFSSFFPMHIELIAKQSCLAEGMGCNVLSFQNGTIALPAVLKSLFMLAVILLALRFSLRDPQRLQLSLVCLLIIGFNFMLHSIIGDEMFLYAQHWLMPLTLLLIPLLTEKKAALYAFIAVQLVLNGYFFVNLESMLNFA